MGFSRGSQQTVVINVASENTTKMVNKTFKMTGGESATKFTPFELVPDDGEMPRGTITGSDEYSTISSKGPVDHYLSPGGAAEDLEVITLCLGEQKGDQS